MINSEFYPLWQSKTDSAEDKIESTPASDKALAKAAGQGDMKAFEELYKRHNRRV